MDATNWQEEITPALQTTKTQSTITAARKLEGWLSDASLTDQLSTLRLSGIQQLSHNLNPNRQKVGLH